MELNQDIQPDVTVSATAVYDDVVALNDAVAEQQAVGNQVLSIHFPADPDATVEAGTFEVKIG